MFLLLTTTKNKVKDLKKNNQINYQVYVKKTRKTFETIKLYGHYSHKLQLIIVMQTKMRN